MSSTPTQAVESLGQTSDMSPADSSVPKDWQLMPLGALCSFANGVNADKQAYGEGVRFVNVLEVITHSHLHAADIPGRVRLSKLQCEAFEVLRGDLLFNRTSETQEEVGLSSVYDDDERVVFGGFVIRGRFTSDAFNRAYAGYALRTPIVRAQIIARGQGAIRANIGQASLGRVLVPVPSKPEQQAIAEALSDVDGLLRALEALITKKRAIKQAAMQQLLTGKTRLPGFSGEWETAQLPQVTTIRKGELMTASTLTPGPVPVIAGGMAPAYFHAWANRSHPCVTISASGANAGYVAYHRTPIFASDCSTVEGASRVSTEFVYYWLASNQHHVYGLQSGGAQPHVQPKDLARLSISFPMLDEQRAINAVLSDLDSAIAALEARRDMTRAIKQGMMQQLLTGRVRLVKSEAA